MRGAVTGTSVAVKHRRTERQRDRDVKKERQALTEVQAGRQAGRQTDRQ